MENKGNRVRPPLPADELINSTYLLFGEFGLPASATNHPGCFECEEYAADLAGVQRQDLTIQQIGTLLWGPISFLTPEAMAYYFPRLAELAIRNERNKEDDPFRNQFLIAIKNSKDKQFTLFESNHKSAVVDVLKFLEKERSSLRDDDDTSLDLLDVALASWNSRINPEC